MVEMTRSSASCDGVLTAVGAVGPCDSGCREKEGSRSHDDQEDADGCDGCGNAALGAWLPCAAAAGVVPAAAEAARACCIHTSRVLWSTGHFSSSPTFAVSGPDPFMLAAPAAAVPTALSPWAIPSLLTRTVSSNSVCITPYLSTVSRVCVRFVRGL